MLFYHKLAAQSSALDLIWQSEKSCSQTIQIFTDASQEYLKGRAILNTMHLHLSARRWKQMWKLPIFLCTTICPLTVMCCSAFLYLLHLQQIGLENIVFLKKSRASRKGCLLMQAGCSLNFLSTAFCGAWGGTMWISSKNSSINRWFMTQFFSLMFCFPNFMKYKQREMSCSFFVSPSEISWKPAGGKTDLFIQIFSNSLSSLLLLSFSLDLFWGGVTSSRGEG